MKAKKDKAKFDLDEAEKRKWDEIILIFLLTFIFLFFLVVHWYD